MVVKRMDPLGCSTVARRGRQALLALALAVGACGDGDPDLATEEGPAASELVGCGAGGRTFPRSALDSLRDAPPPDGAMAEGMRSFLESGEGAFWPQEGWRVLSSTGDVTELVVDADSQLWFQTLERRGGVWVWSGSSATPDCPLRVPAPDGFNDVLWRLDPDHEAPGPSSTEVHVLVHETACASGEPVGDRLVGPQVEVTATEARLGFLAKAQEGDFNCPSNPETPITVPLEEPLGDRSLVDAYDLGQDLRDHL
jgi:hypothetical protein